MAVAARRPRPAGRGLRRRGRRRQRRRPADPRGQARDPAGLQPHRRRRPRPGGGVRGLRLRPAAGDGQGAVLLRHPRHRRALAPARARPGRRALPALGRRPHLHLPDPPRRQVRPAGRPRGPGQGLHLRGRAPARPRPAVARVAQPVRQADQRGRRLRRRQGQVDLGHAGARQPHPPDHPRPAGQRLPQPPDPAVLLAGPRGVRLQVPAGPGLRPAPGRLRALPARAVPPRPADRPGPQRELGPEDRPAAQRLGRQGQRHHRPAARPRSRRRSRTEGPTSTSMPCPRPSATSSACSTTRRWPAAGRRDDRLRPLPDHADGRRADQEAGRPPGGQLRHRPPGGGAGHRGRVRRRAGHHRPLPHPGRPQHLRPVPVPGRRRRPRQGPGAAGRGRLPRRGHRSPTSASRRRNGRPCTRCCGRRWAGPGSASSRPSTRASTPTASRCACGPSATSTTWAAARVCPDVPGNGSRSIIGVLLDGRTDHRDLQQQLRQLQQRQGQRPDRPGLRGPRRPGRRPPCGARSTGW